jgi:type VI secretion system protein ImpM
MSTFAPPGLYGKIPSRGDFVRLRAAEEPARSLVLWLEQGSEAAKRGGAAADSEAVGFLFRPAGAPRALLGAVADSVDKVGRAFPLAVFVPVDCSEISAAFPALAAAAEPFLEAAKAVLAGAASLSPTDLVARVEALPCPGTAELSAADAEARAVAAREDGRELLARLLGPSTEQQAYGLECVRSACRPARGSEGGARGVVLACPARGRADRWFWLELARRLLQWPGPPSFFWRTSAAPELFISVGTLPPSVFGDFWRPRPQDPRVWPVTTAQASAMAAARRSLGRDALGVLEGPGCPVNALLDVLTIRSA